jgi:hypothetical protein
MVLIVNCVIYVVLLLASEEKDRKKKSRRKGAGVMPIAYAALFPPASRMNEVNRDSFFLKPITKTRLFTIIRRFVSQS